MIPRRLGFGLLMFVGLFILGAGLAGGAATVVSGTGTISGSGTSYTLRITNTGTEPIKCWRLTLPAGVMATAIGKPPDGWQVGAPGPLPQPVLGGQSTAGIPPGGSADFPLTTDKGFPPELKSALRISGDCKSDVDAAVTGPTGGGSTPPPPTPKPKPKCKCESLEIVEGSYTRQGKYDIGFNLDWRLTCTPTGGGGCSGKIEVVPPASKRYHFDVVVPEGGERICKGDCRKPTTGPAFVRIRVEDDKDGAFLFGDRKGQTFRFKLNLFCKRGAKFVRVGTKGVEIAYDEDGKFDPKQSDLNADGTPDGDEKK